MQLGLALGAKAAEPNLKTTAPASLFSLLMARSRAGLVESGRLEGHDRRKSASRRVRLTHRRSAPRRARLGQLRIGGAPTRADGLIITIES